MITTSLNFSQLDAKTFSSMLKDKPGMIIDIRTPGEYAENHIHNAINIDFYSMDFEDQLKQLDKSTPIYIYCRTGSRTKIAIEILKKLDFKEAYDLKGGIIAWEVNNF